MHYSCCERRKNTRGYGWIREKRVTLLLIPSHSNTFTILALCFLLLDGKCGVWMFHLHIKWKTLDWGGLRKIPQL